jgi:CubicO group peptidase (beta-lactamase class C family)
MSNFCFSNRIRLLQDYHFHLFIISILVFTVFLLSSCARKPSLPDYWPTKEWRTATPESQGMDSNTLAETLSFIKDKQLPVHSLFIARRGYVVLDEYFYPFSDGLRHDVASVTKSITATLVGMAMEEGHIQDLTTPVLSIFDEGTAANMDARKQQMTVAHLLSMTSGLECGYRPGERELFEMRETTDWIQFSLDLPMRRAPGTEFAYCSSGMHLISGIVTRATGESLEAYAASRLFQPLGIKDWYWPADPAGNSDGWGDLQLHPRDMAKIGLLYLYQGQWEGRQIISSDWIKQATRPQIDTATKGVSYGYGWWLVEFAGMSLIEAQGRGGQLIVIWPEKEIVVVLTAGGLQTADELAGYLARAVRSDKSIAENPQAMTRLKEISAALKLPLSPQPVAKLPAMSAQISGHWYQLEPNQLGLEAMRFEVNGQEMALGIMIGGQQYLFPVGLDGVYRISNQTPSKLPAGVRGEWTSEDTFVLEYDEIGRVNDFTFTIQFSGNSIHASVTEPTGLYQLALTGELID